jgi:tungstate transport system substrate-binding protein
MAPSRRELLQLSAAALLVPACSRRSDPPAATKSDVVRVASVLTTVEGNLLPELVRTFAGRVDIVAGGDVYGAARAGKADLVISHYGHRDAEQYILDGLGEFPRTICSNQLALLGPPSDPAKIRGLVDAGEAFQRIADSRSPFLLNDLDGIRYLAEILWNAIGRPSRDGWWLDPKEQKEDAMRRAVELGAYTFWGLTPFLRTRVKLEPLVLADPLLQRLMVSVVVRGANVDGAHALQDHLLAPATQAHIRTTRYPSDQHICWVPAGRHNRTAVLPKA